MDLFAFFIFNLWMVNFSVLVWKSRILWELLWWNCYWNFIGVFMQSNPSVYDWSGPRLSNFFILVNLTSLLGVAIQFMKLKHLTKSNFHFEIILGWKCLVFSDFQPVPKAKFFTSKELFKNYVEQGVKLVFWRNFFKISPKRIFYWKISYQRGNQERAN